MSRRATPSQAAQNQQTIKSLLKLDTNKICADCKRNKHPRWASWNIGVFICIRCSGIHRGMGTHISRVKSVDLDSWTDEQLQSVLKWGNARANKYWESKLAPGHVPSEAKIENFIRTKYESKRWVMDGGMPDPSTLDDDEPLAVVQEKAKIERSTSQRVAASSQPAVQRQQPSIDLFGDDIAPPARPSTTDPTPRVAPPQQPPAPKQNKPGDSLLGLDFFGDTQPPSSRPASTSSTPANPTGMSRPDLKQSILSLYAKPPPAPAAPPQHERNPSFGDMTSPQPQPSSNMGGLTDAFSGLSFPSTTSPPPKPAEKPSPFANLTSFATKKSPPAEPKISSPTASASGGSLFDSLTSPTAPAPPKPQSRQTSISSNGFGQSFSNFASPTAKPQSPSSFANDLVGLSSPPPVSSASPPKPSVISPQEELSSAFNLSSPAPPAPKPDVATTTSTTTTSAVPPSMLASSIDPFESNAWNTPDPTPAQPSASSMMQVPDTLTPNDIGAGWGSTTTTSKQATVAADEDFGGWTSAAPVSSSTTTTTTTNTGMPPKPPGGFSGADDLFSNVWE
ncbi:Stromal membrane-associated protein [Aspergillus sclerotialis]|uniref:Stromal membrane-associated protein n=1 Tax=Aspergillus sclerotialis TaxID=2070753 RepID=A0A3A2ZA14_9EURO|nr:Stromal membrane-associated protein [Aspergillus sclerotialis]